MIEYFHETYIKRVLNSEKVHLIEVIQIFLYSWDAVSLSASPKTVVPLAVWTSCDCALQASIQWALCHPVMPWPVCLTVLGELGQNDT